MYRISILVPFFNAENWIERCARSLFEQTYPELEFVFVNDGSSDSSVEVLNRVEKDYPGRKNAVKIVSHDKNKGIAAARNTALDNAAGDFVCWVDSDDWMELNALELLVKKQKENNVDIVSGNRMMHFPDKVKIWQERHYSNKEEMTLQMMQRTWDHFMTGRLIQRSLFFEEGLRCKESLDVAEDRYLMTVLAYRARGFDTVDNVVYHYERRNSNAITMVSTDQSIFRINNQELDNIALLRQFFKDKEDVYQLECMRRYMEQLRLNLKIAIEHSSKLEFDKIVDVMDARSYDEWNLVGWQKTGIKGRYLHNYLWRRLNCLTIKSVRFFKERWTKLFQ